MKLLPYKEAGYDKIDWRKLIEDSIDRSKPIYTHVRKVDLTVWPHKTTIHPSGAAAVMGFTPAKGVGHQPPASPYTTSQKPSGPNGSGPYDATTMSILQCRACGTTQNTEWPCDAQGQREPILDGSGIILAHWACSPCLFKGILCTNHDTFATIFDSMGDLERIYCADCNCIYWDSLAYPRFICNTAHTSTPPPIQRMVGYWQPGPPAGLGVQTLKCTGGCNSTLHVHGWPLGGTPMNVLGQPAGWVCTFCMNKAKHPRPNGDCSEFGVRLDANGDLDQIFCHACGDVYWEALSATGFGPGHASARAFVQALQAGGYPGVALDDFEPKKTPNSKLCTKCARELSKTLDAYYGQDQEMAKRCSSCR